jgi:hypothetical protein
MEPTKANTDLATLSAAPSAHNSALPDEPSSAEQQQLALAGRSLILLPGINADAISMSPVPPAAVEHKLIFARDPDNPTGAITFSENVARDPALIDAALYWLLHRDDDAQRASVTLDCRPADEGGTRHELTIPGEAGDLLLHIQLPPAYEGLVLPSSIAFHARVVVRGANDNADDTDGDDAGDATGGGAPSYGRNDSNQCEPAPTQSDRSVQEGSGSGAATGDDDDDDGNSAAVSTGAATCCTTTDSSSVREWKETVILPGVVSTSDLGPCDAAGRLVGFERRRGLCPLMLTHDVKLVFETYKPVLGRHGTQASLAKLAPHLRSALVAHFVDPGLPHDWRITEWFYDSRVDTHHKGFLGPRRPLRQFDGIRELPAPSRLALLPPPPPPLLPPSPLID